MKKATKMITAFLSTFLFLAGCQATPDEPVVIQKDMEQMIEKAGAVDAGQTQGATLRERTGASETFVMNGTSGALTLTADALVILPDVDGMPILNVRSAVFSQETVDKYWDALVGDRPMWAWSDQPTKEQIAQMIVAQKKLKADAQEDSPAGETEGYDSIIAELERLYQAAPETTEVAPATSQLREKINWDPVLGTIDTRYMGASGHSAKSEAEALNAKDWIYFCVGNPWTGDMGSIKSDASPATIRFEASAINHCYFNATEIDEDTVLDDSVVALLKMTPREAKQKVEELLSHTGTPMAVYSMRLLSDADEAAGKAAAHYAYGFTCVRVLEGGLTVAVTPKGSASDIMPPGYMPAPSPPAFTSFWTYEHLEIELNDNGFFQIGWQSPLEVMDTAVKDCNLLSFEDIRAVFEKMLYVSYEPNIEDGYTMTCNVSQVRLEMMRVRKQNADPKALEGLLIPVWNFYGRVSIYDSGGNLVGASMHNATILSVNAVDGSVIDRLQGY